MKLSTKRLLFIDRLFWLPHNAVEFFFSFLSRPGKNPSDNVFVIKFMGMGSIIRFASLCEQHHVDKSKITLVTFQQHEEVCRLFGFSHLLIIRTKNLTYFIQDNLNLFSRIRSIRPSHIIDYERCSHAVSTLRLLLAWSGRSTSISFEPERNIQRNNLNIFPADKITLEKLFAIGIKCMAKVESKISVLPIEVISNKILININASDFLSARRYSIDSFVEIIKNLYQQDNALTFYLTGSSHEFDYVEKIVERLKGLPVYNTSGRWTFQELIQQLSSCSCFITCDSGPVHLAIYLLVPTIAIWGPTQPSHFGYNEVSHLHSISLKLECSPCFKHPASVPAMACQGRIDCLNNLPPSFIVKKVLSLLEFSSKNRTVHFPPLYTLQHHLNLTTVEK